MVNELRAAGAEAISLNGQRLIGSSEIRCVGPTVLVNERRLAAPFVISAIGNPQTLESSLKLRGGVIDNFKFWGIRADVVQSDKVRVPAFKGNRTFEFAKMVVSKINTDRQRMKDCDCALEDLIKILVKKLKEIYLDDFCGFSTFVSNCCFHYDLLLLP